MALSTKFLKNVLNGKVHWAEKDEIYNYINIKMEISLNEYGLKVELYDNDTNLVKTFDEIKIFNGDTVILSGLLMKISAINIQDKA